MWDLLDLRDVVRLLNGRWKRLVSVVLFSAMLGLYFGWVVMPPSFTASAMLYISGSVEGGTDPGTLSQSQKLAETCILLLQSDRVLETVLAEVGLDGYHPESLRRHLKLHPLRETGMVRVSVTGPDPEMSAWVANLLADQADGELSRVVRGGSAVVAEPAKPPETTDLPGPFLYGFAGALLGGAGFVLYVIARARLGDRIRGHKEWERLCGARLLGETGEGKTDAVAGHLRLILDASPQRGVVLLPLQGAVQGFCGALAAALAKTGNRVLAVADGWQGTGLSTLLGEGCEPSDAIRNGKEFDLLPMESGLRDSPPEIFESLLTWLQTRYDVILFDCSQLEGTAAGLLIAQKCAGVLLVAQDGASRRELEKLAAQMQFSGVRLLGVVVAQKPK